MDANCSRLAGGAGWCAAQQPPSNRSTTRPPPYRTTAGRLALHACALPVPVPVEADSETVAASGSEILVLRPSESWEDRDEIRAVQANLRVSSSRLYRVRQRRYHTEGLNAKIFCLFGLSVRSRECRLCRGTSPCWTAGRTQARCRCQSAADSQSVGESLISRFASRSFVGSVVMYADD